MMTGFCQRMPGLGLMYSGMGVEKSLRPGPLLCEI